MGRKIRRIIAGLTVLVMSISALGGNITGVLQAKAETKVSNPRIAYDGTVTWDKIQFGSYPQDMEEIVTEPIKWRILDIDDEGNAFLLADEALDYKPYNSHGVDETTDYGYSYTNYSCTWETSTLRSWLNGTGDYAEDAESFINTAFSEEEKNAIIETDVVNDNNPTYDTAGGNTTRDKIYLLSIAEASKEEYGFDTTFENNFGSNTRGAKATDYTHLNGAYRDKYAGCIGNVDWWLRSPGCYTNKAVIVQSDTSSFIDGYFVYQDLAVRPVLHVNLSSEYVKDAGTVTTYGYGSLEKNSNSYEKSRISKYGTTWDCVWFGNYKQQAKKKPIEWRVLSVNGDDAFVLAENVIDYMPYGKEYIEYSCTWETSLLRSWLNGYYTSGDTESFFNDAFTDIEKNAIIATEVVNDKNPTFETAGGNTTLDKIYLLSIEEASKKEYGFDTIESSMTRKAKETDYAHTNKGKYFDGDGYWWLRSSGNNDSRAAIVGSGYISEYGFGVDKVLGVRPALHVDISSPCVKVAGTVSADSNISIEKAVVSNPYRTAIKEDNIDNCNVTWNSVYFGNYPQSDASGNTKDPIRWQVLSVDENNVAVLLAEQNLDICPYNNTIAEIGWKDCSLRQWLNNDFLNTAFSQEEQNVLVDNDKDKVSLLTDSQALNAKYGFYPSTDKDNLRIKRNTAFAAAGGSSGYTEVSAEGQANSWWLKSGGYYKDDAECVSDKGSVRADGITVAYGGNAVCPVVYVDLNKANEFGLISNADDLTQTEKIKKKKSRGYTYDNSHDLNGSYREGNCFWNYRWRFNINGEISISPTLFSYSYDVIIPQYIEDHGNKYRVSEIEGCKLVSNYNENGEVKEWNNAVNLLIPDTVNYIEENAFKGNESKIIICGKVGSYAEKYAKDNAIEFIEGNSIQEAKSNKIKKSINSKYVATLEKAEYTLDFSDYGYLNSMPVVFNISPMLENTENKNYFYGFEEGYDYGWDLDAFNAGLRCYSLHFENDKYANVTKVVLNLYPSYIEGLKSNVGSDILNVWITDVASDEKIAYAEIPIEITDRNNTLIKWNDTYSITLDANGGYMTWSEDENGNKISYDQYYTFKVPVGDAIGYGHCYPQSLNNKEFLGWKTEGDNTLYKETPYYLKDGEKYIGDYVPTADVTFVAQWKDDGTAEDSQADNDSKQDSSSSPGQDENTSNENATLPVGESVNPENEQKQSINNNSQNPAITSNTNIVSSPETAQNTNATQQSGITQLPNADNSVDTFDVGKVIENKDVEYVITERAAGQTQVSYKSPKNTNKTSYTIPDTIPLSDGTVAKVTEIAPEAFKKCRKLRKVVIGKNVSRIKKNSFNGCKNLKTIIIKSTKLTKNSFGKNAFKGINKKSTFTLPKKQFKNYKKWIKKAGAPKTAKYKK